VNYRHAFHAGSFADVVKHAVLARIVTHLRDKPAAFRVIDTHAGAGLYDLSGPEATRGGEWRDGIGRVMAAQFSPDVAALLAPYRDAVAALNNEKSGGEKDAERLTVYPGSPVLVRAWLRPQDRLIACELEPKAARALTAALRGEPRAKALELDGWIALGAYVPPKERRGLVLVDPPFEEEQDYYRLAQGLGAAHRKWATGIYMLWYPIKGRPEPDALAKSMRRLGIARILRAELCIAPLNDPSRLNGSGLLVVNPPWRLESELKLMFPALAGVLERPRASVRIDWLAGEDQR
jgi:23S rRNA (adenine2030-N6)-methyltransferase